MHDTPTSDEKVMAALSHGSIFLAFVGPVVPLGIWMSQRKKSKYVCFHALQAMGYQALMFWLYIVVTLVVAILGVCLLMPFSLFLMQDSDSAILGPLAFNIILLLTMFGSLGVLFLTAIFGAVSCLMGREFRYPLIGKWLERHLPYDPASEAEIDELQEERWVAGICHATAVLQFWGIATPLIVWFSQKERSARLGFHSMQAFVYQSIAFAAYLAGMLMYVIMTFAMILVPIAASASGAGRDAQGPVLGIMLVFVALVMIFWLGTLILLPVYYLLAGVASLRVIQGKPFRYLLIGNLLRKWMKLSDFEATV
jgi:uncharacterized Tic20 family protein